MQWTRNTREEKRIRKNRSGDKERLKYINGKKDGMFLVGGFVGELMRTFTCLYDYILANP